MKALQSLRGHILGAAGIALVLSATAIGAVPPPAGVAPVSTPVGGFAIDGSLIANQSVGGTSDWLKLPSVPGTGEGVIGLNGIPLNPNVTFHYAESAGVDGADNLLKNGKWEGDPNDWSWTMGKTSAHTDIGNVLLHLTTDAEGHVWVIIAADRLSNQESTFLDFEFLQNTLQKNSDFTFTSQGPDGGRTTKDLLLRLALPKGGTAANFSAWRWSPKSQGGFGYVDATASLSAGKVFAAVNSNSTFVPYVAFGRTNYMANTFAEVAIDLTALLGNPGPGGSLSAKTIMVKTTKADDVIKDFIDPIQITTLVDATAPVLHVPANVTLEFPADTTTNATGVATATDASGPCSITFCDAVTNVCGTIQCIKRTWTAVDAFGNSASDLQTITVVENLVPVLVSIDESPEGSGNFTLGWELMAGRTYHFQWRENLLAGEWQNLLIEGQEDYIAAAANVTIQHAVGAGAPHGFFRALVVTP